MSTLPENIFKPRQVSDDGVQKQDSTEIASVRWSKNVTELTKTQKYCVSRLPTTPTNLNQDSTQFQSAYTDHISNYGIICGKESVHVWMYKSTDAIPLSVEFPLEENSTAVLTEPVNGNSKDPGIIIIGIDSGNVKLYESVFHAPALGLIKNKSLELTLVINRSKGEYISLAQNVEPAGVVVATSWKRCILLSLRDFKGKSRLQATEFLPHNSGLLSGILGAFKGTNKNGLIDEIVSIKSGNIFNNGATQEIVTLDSLGGFSIFTHESSPAGESIIDKKKRVNINLVPSIESGIEGYLPGSNLNLGFLDIWPLKSDEESTFLALCYVDTPDGESGKKALLLITMKVNETGALLLESHRLSSCDPIDSFTNNERPRLYVPSPGVVAFVTIGNSIIMSELKSSPTNNFQYFRSRWQDEVRFKKSVQLLGSGYEDESLESNPSVILVTKSSGILRVEAYTDSIDLDQKTENSQSSLEVLKSHIEQGIFYSKSQEIDFDVKNHYSDIVIVDALKQVCEHILSSKSYYLQHVSYSLAYFLKLKVDLFNNLIVYVRHNFNSTWPKVGSLIVTYLEKSDIALNLWKCMIEEPLVARDLEDLFERSLLESNISKGTSTSNLIQTFFINNVENINQVLTHYIDILVTSEFSSKFIINLLTRSIYDGVYVNEEKYVMNEESLAINKSWIFDTVILIRLEDVFTREFYERNEHDTFFTQKSKSQLLKLAKVLYYLTNLAISYMESYDAFNDQLDEYKRWYKNRKSIWMDVLITHGLDEDAFKISVQYKDFDSLAKILEKERRSTVERFGKQSPEYKALLDVKFFEYFKAYGYHFASSLYLQMINEGDIQSLIIEFPGFKEYLYKFFASNTEKTSDFSWIRFLLDRKYDLVSSNLINSVQLESEVSIANRQLKYSIAKLASKASKGGDFSQNADSDLKAIRIQRNFYRKLLEYVSGQKELLSLDYVIRNFTAEDISFHLKRDVFEKSFERLIAERKIQPTELINILTLVKPVGPFVSVFSNCFELCQSITIPEEFEYWCKVIWLRLIVLAENWQSVFRTRESENVVREKIHATVFWKSLSSVGDSRTLNFLRDVLSDYVLKVGDKTFTSEASSDINSTLLTYLKEIDQKYDLIAWLPS